MHNRVRSLHNTVMSPRAVEMLGPDRAVATTSLVSGRMVGEPPFAVSRRSGAESWLVLLTTAGEGWARTTGVESALPPRRLLLLAPRVPHSYGTEHTWSNVWVHFRARAWWQQLLDWGGPAATGPGVLDLEEEDAHACEQALDSAGRALLAGGTFADELGLAHLETVLLTAARAGRSTRPTDPRVVAAVELLAGSLDRPYRAEELAAAMHLSSGRAAKLFTSVMGVSPQRYSAQRKIDQACRLLELTDFSIARIARTVGFETESYFTRRFGLETGVSPTAYRSGRRG